MKVDCSTMTVNLAFLNTFYCYIKAAFGGVSGLTNHLARARTNARAWALIYGEADAFAAMYAMQA